MKYIKNIASIALLVALSSCKKEDDSIFDQRNVKPIISADATSFNVTEGDVITITLTTDVPYKTDMDFKIALVGGSATFRDFVCTGPVDGYVRETEVTDGQGLIAYVIKFPAYQKTATFTLSPVFDDLPETTENFVFELSGALGNLGAIAESSKTITMNAANKTSGDLNISMDWSGTKANSHGTLNGATYLNNVLPTPASRSFAGLDFDFYVEDAGGSIVFAAETGDCPEVITLPASTPDGTYYIWGLYYSLNGATNATTPKSVNIPMIVTCAKPGVFYNQLDKTGRFNTLSVPNVGSAVEYFREIEKSGSTWTIKDINTSEIIISGRNSNSGTRLERIQKKILGRRK